MKVVKKYSEPGRWEVNIPFTKVGEEREWLGIVDAREPGEYDLMVVADHKEVQTKGKIVVKAVVGSESYVRLRGMIKICKEAQESDDFLELRVLLLDKSARAVVEPELEIEANNVKASHAASIGQVDREQILYLMSRGLSRESAQEQIVKGWLGV